MKAFSSNSVQCRVVQNHLVGREVMGGYEGVEDMLGGMREWGDFRGYEGVGGC